MVSELLELMDVLRPLAPSGGLLDLCLELDLVCASGELGRVGRFLLERIEVDIYPEKNSYLRPLVAKQSLWQALRTFLAPDRDPLTAHLLAWRFVSVGIPSNPVQLHHITPTTGSITVEPPFKPELWPGRMLLPREEERTTIMRALRLVGAVVTYELPAYSEGLCELPARGYGPKDWPNSWMDTEPQAVWTFRT